MPGVGGSRLFAGCGAPSIAEPLLAGRRGRRNLAAMFASKPTRAKLRADGKEEGEKEAINDIIHCVSTRFGVREFA